MLSLKDVGQKDRVVEDHRLGLAKPHHHFLRVDHFPEFVTGEQRIWPLSPAIGLIGQLARPGQAPSGIRRLCRAGGKPEGEHGPVECGG
jgi:hypothetical protein